MYIVVGLGNPGEEYSGTRHNTGRMASEFIAKKEFSGVKVVYIDTFMNKSGLGVAKFVKSQKAAEKLIVIHDDLDLPMGSMKVSFNRGAGGHRGIESVIRSIKTEKFIRIRIGISPATPGGKTKKPKGEEDVNKFILGKFKPNELEILKKIFKRTAEAVELISTEGLETAQTRSNS